MEFVIITGMSGAGKSQAATAMEDMGFFCVDNLPVPLIGKFAELGMNGSGEYDRVVLVTDVRAGVSFDGLLQALDELKQAQCPYSILFVDASDDTIIKRYKETRRSHPLIEEAGTLEEAIETERRRLKPLKDRADHVIDTSDLPTAKLRQNLHDLFQHGRDRSQSMQVVVTSFGFKHGIPRTADIVFDVRFLPNPYYVPQLRNRNGLDEDVRDYVYSNGQAQELVERLEGMLDFLLPCYVEEGKSSLVIAIGCTGGHHRSVAVAHALATFVAGRGYTVAEDHRDLTRN